MRLFRALFGSAKRLAETPKPIEPEPEWKNNAIGKMNYILFHKYLLTTNTVSSGVLMVAGDLMSQEIEYQQGLMRERYDWWRVGRMFIVGAIQGPMHHYFYGWLDRVYRATNGQNVTKKILYDQLVMSPACIVAFFYSAGWLEGRTTADCTDELQRKVVRVYVVSVTLTTLSIFHEYFHCLIYQLQTDWTVWPAAQFINFYYLHPRYRVIYVNFVTMLYNVFLSYIKHDASKVYAEVKPKENISDETHKN